MNVSSYISQHSVKMVQLRARQIMINLNYHYRDYCCIRQHLADQTGRIVVSSRTTEHHKCPALKRNWRVQDYQSVMAVRPTCHPDKPGVEFSVTGELEGKLCFYNFTLFLETF